MKLTNLMLVGALALNMLAPTPRTAWAVADSRFEASPNPTAAVAQSVGLNIDVQCAPRPSKIYLPTIFKQALRQLSLWLAPEVVATANAATANQTAPLGATMIFKVATRLTGAVTFSAAPLPLMKNAMLDATTGKFTFTPEPDQVGNYALTITASNGTQTESTVLTIAVPQPNPSDDTAMCGRILDANEAAKGIAKPLAGATVMHLQSRRTATTDANGFFKFTGLPSGIQQFDFDGRSAPPLSFYGAYRSEVPLIANVVNEISRPVYIMKIDADSVTSVNPNAVTVVSNAAMSATMTIPANTVKDGVGGYYAGLISLSQVPQDFTPASLPDTLDPALVMTIQPMGLTFAQPVPISFRNLDNLAPGSEVDIWSMDHATSEFFIAGKGKVSADGKMINTISGGIRESSWHFVMALKVILEKIKDRLGDKQTTCPKKKQSSMVSLHSGCIETTIDLPAYVSQGNSHSLEFVYNSGRAYPRPFVPFEATIPVQSALPKRISYSVINAGGVRNDAPIFINTNGLSESKNEPIRGVADLDFSNSATGVYPYTVRLTNYFAQSSISSDIKDNALVVNEKKGDFGAGWSLAGLERLHFQPDKSVLSVNGNGSATRFRTGSIQFDNFDDLSGIQLNGEASGANLDGRSVLRLATNGIDKGSAFFRGSTPLQFGVNPAHLATNFSFQISNSGGLGGGGDGLTFVLGTNPNALGLLGGYLGYAGIPSSLAIEFDTFANGWDPNANHVGINISGSVASKVTVAEATSFKNGKRWFVWIEYDGKAQLLDVRWAQNNVRPATALLTYTINLPSLLGQNTAFAGFTAGTASGYGDHDILDWTLTSTSTTTTAMGERFLSPNGEFSALTKNLDGTYTRRLKDGTEMRFNAAGYQTALVDRHGNTTSYAYDSANRLITLTDPVGKVTTLAYINGKLSSATDPAGRVTAFTHDAAGNLTRVTLPDGAQRSFGYDSRHLMTSETDERGQQTTRVYDAWGRLTSANLPMGVTRFSSASQSVGLIDPASGLGSINNPAPVTRPADAKTIMTDGEGRKTTYVMSPINTIGSIGSAAGFTTTYQRDGDGNATQTTLPSGAIYQSTFDGQGNALTQRDQTLNAQTSFAYESSFNQIASVTDPFNKTTTFSYDDKGNLTTIRTPLNRTLAMSYTNQGLVSNWLDTLGTPTTLTYDGAGNPTQIAAGAGGDQRSVSLGYTSAGYVQSITDPLGRASGFVYDAVGRVTTETLPGNRVVGYGYDAAGNLISLTPPSKPAHGFEYNALGLLSAYVPPAVAGSGSTRTTYDYNKAQQLVRVVRPDGAQIGYTYDFGGRLMTLSEPRGNLTLTYSTSSGQISAITSPDGVRLGYGYSGELLTSLSWSGPLAGTVGFSYDGNYRRKSEAVNGNTVNYAYDADGGLIGAGNLSLVYSATSGLLNTTALGSVSDGRSYNAFGEMTGYSAKFGGAPLYETSCAHDKLGRITSKTETISGTTTTYSYGYDATGRLAEVQQNGSVVATYTYDANGNRLTGPGGATGSYDDQDRLLQYGSTSYAYTANGELQTATTGGQATNYTYDTAGSLIAVGKPDGTQIGYVIDGQNRRVGKKVNGTLVQGFLYASQLRPIAELDGSGTLVSRFVYGTKVNVPEYMVKGGITYRLITDHLGSVRLVVNTATGAIVQRMDYDAWGKVLLDTQPGFQPFGFAGGLYDAATGLVRFGARDYDAEVGRWTTKDPIGFEGGDSNFYGYVSDDPLNDFDPSGLIPDPSDVAALACGPAAPACLAGKEAIEFCIWVAIGLRAGQTLSNSSSGQSKPIDNLGGESSSGSNGDQSKPEGNTNGESSSDSSGGQSKIIDKLGGEAKPPFNDQRGRGLIP